MYKYLALKAVAEARGGDPNVPQDYPVLGWWLSNQRRDYKSGRLSLERIQALEAIGVEWNVYEERWDRMFERLKTAARKRHGDPNVPLSYPVLGNWLNNQRIAYRAGKMAADRAQALEALGVWWYMPPTKNHRQPLPRLVTHTPAAPV